MTAERLRRLSASPWLDVAIGVAATVTTWIELLGQGGHTGTSTRYRQLVRAGFRKILEAEDDIAVLAEASTGREAIAAARRCQPDVVLMDIRMPDMDGLEATRQLLRDDPALTRVLILTTFARRPDRSLRAAPGLSELTTREHEVLTLLARGLSNSQIAGQLIISDATVKTHVAQVLMKLDLPDRDHAVIFAYETGLVQPGET